MSFPSWLRDPRPLRHRGTTAGNSRAAACPIPAARYLPRLEVLEDRSVPSHTPLSTAQPNNEELRRFRAEASGLLELKEK